MPSKKRRRKGDPRDDTEDFQMMDIDFNPPSSVPIPASTSAVINISQWDIDDDRIHGKSSLASIEDPMVESPSALSATDSTTQATFDYDKATFDYDIESTFHDADEDISPEHDTSAKRSFLAVSHFCLTTITAVLESQSLTFHFLG
jgi:hypothetical protein